MAQKEADKETELVRAIVFGAAYITDDPTKLSNLIGGSDENHAKDFGDGMAHNPSEPIEGVASLIKAVGEALRPR